MGERLGSGKSKARATVVDVARVAEVSYGVAADILRDKTRYSYRPETIARVQQTAQELAYRPNRVAQAMTTGRTHQIALCLPYFGASYTTQLIRAFDLTMRETPYDLLVTSHQSLVHRDITADGLFFYGPTSQLPLELPLPMVLIAIQQSGTRAPHVGCDAVFLDILQSSRAAMQHYLEQGCKRILFVAGAIMMQPCEPRYAAYHAAMKSARLPIETLALELPHEEHIRQRAHECLREYFAAHGFPDALFCSNDDIAIGAYRALREAGRRIPQQTAVLGYDDVEESPDLRPALTSIQIPYEAAIRRAWAMLKQRLQNPQHPLQHAVLKSLLNVRDSSCFATPRKLT